MEEKDLSAKASGKQIEDLPGLLEQIREHPPMWLGTTTVSGLKNLLDGIHLAEIVHGIPETQCLSGFALGEYEAWVERKYNLKRLSVNSFHLASVLTESEKEAFWKWFEWYDEFRQRVTLEGGS